MYICMHVLLCQTSNPMDRCIFSSKVIRPRASVMKVGVVDVDVLYVPICILDHLKEELAYRGVDKWLRVISTIMLFKKQ